MRRMMMSKTEEMKGKQVKFYLDNKPVVGIVKGFKLPGFIVKGDGIPKDTRIPAMAMKYLKVTEAE
jgi:hypothetical protein